MGRSRDIAEFLSKTELNNPTNTSLLKSTDTTGIDSAAVQGIGLTSFSTLDSLPATNLVVGQQAYVTGTNRLYISNGVGWYNTTLVNRSPTWDSEPLSTYEIVDSATPLIITAKALDSDTSLNYLVDQSSATDSAQYMVNITSDSSVFTFTPKSADSIGIEVAAGNLTDSNGDFVYTFKWSDGVSFVAKAATISYSPAGGSSGPSYWNGSSAQLRSGRSIAQAMSSSSSVKDLSSGLSNYTGAPSGPFKFSPDGTYFFHAAYNQTKTRVYTLNSPWDLYSNHSGYTEYTHPSSITCFDMHISEDGTKYYLAMYNDAIYEYTLSTPWDASTISLTNTMNAGSSNTQFNNYYGIGGIHVSPDGDYLVLTTQTFDRILIYDLDTPFDITSRNLSSEQTLTTDASNYPRGIVVSADGKTFVYQQTSQENVSWFTLPTPWTFSTVTINSQDITTDNQGMGLDIAADGSKIFYGAYVDDKIWEFS